MNYNNNVMDWIKSNIYIKTLLSYALATVLWNTTS